MADLVLTVPFHLAPTHFPWCAIVLREYLKKNNPEVDTHIWDLREENQIQSLFEEYQDCISEMTGFLQTTDHYLGHLGSVISGSHTHYIPVMLKFGNNLFSILQNEKIPFDEKVTESMVQGIPLTEYSNNSASKEIKNIWQEIQKLLFRGEMSK